MSVTRCAWLLLLGWVVGCTGDVEPLSPAQEQAVSAYVSKVPPSPQHQLDIDFGGRARLLGYDLDRDEWRPGETMRVTWYWQSVEPTGEGWKLFTHIDANDHSRTLNQDGNGTLRWLYGPARWRPGTYIRDTQDLDLPEAWTGSAALLYTGIWRDGKRLAVRGDQADATGRVLAVTVPTPTGTGVGRREVPRLVVVRTKRSPRIDGSLADPVWGFANTTRTFVETREGGIAPVQASAKLLWDERHLYVGVDVHDGLLRASHTEHDDHLWEQDCVELMIDPDGDGENYFEIQVSPRGVVFDTRYDVRRVPQPFGHTDWDSRSQIGVASRGDLDDEEADAGYTVEIAIPWQAFSLDGHPIAPPTIGAEWRANLYVMDLVSDRQQAAAWSSSGIGDFHVPRRFGILAFEGSPEAMVGTNEPVQISADRLPRQIERGSVRQRGAEGTMMRKRGVERRHPRQAAPNRESQGAQTLESREAAH